MQVEIRTYMGVKPDFHNDDYLEKHINWRDSSDRKWLTNHTHHCMNNGKCVILIPESN